MLDAVARDLKYVASAAAEILRKRPSRSTAGQDGGFLGVMRGTGAAANALSVARL